MRSIGRLSILHVGKFYPPHRGGMETHLEDICRRLIEFADVRVIVASSDRKTSESVIDGVPVARVGTVATFASTPICPAMAAVIRRTPADIIHLHHPNPMAILAYLSSGHRGRLVITYHSDIVRQRILGNAFQPFLTRAFDRSVAVIATSQRYADTSPTLARYADRCRVIPLGIDVNRFDDSQASVVEEIRRQYGARIVLGVGRLIYYKGFEYLVRAMAAVDGHLLIIGDGPLRATLEREAERCGVSGRITFLGSVPSTAPYYRAADVFVLPSIARSEAYGLVQLEAMASGTPVVDTMLDTGVPYVSPDGVTGLTVPPADVAALAAAIGRLLDDADLRQDYGEAALARVVAEFSVGAMVDQTIDLYHHVLDSATDRIRFEPAINVN